jgi:hypothetical protein
MLMCERPAEAAGDRARADHWPPTDDMRTELPTEMSVVVFCNMLYIKGHIGMEVLSMTEGSIGTYNPAKLRAPVYELYVAFLPGVRNGVKATIYHPLPYPSAALLMLPTRLVDMSMNAIGIPTLTCTRR